MRTCMACILASVNNRHAYWQAPHATQRTARHQARQGCTDDQATALVARSVHSHRISPAHRRRSMEPTRTRCQPKRQGLGQNMDQMHTRTAREKQTQVHRVAA